MQQLSYRLTIHTVIDVRFATTELDPES